MSFVLTVLTLIIILHYIRKAIKKTIPVLLNYMEIKEKERRAILNHLLLEQKNEEEELSLFEKLDKAQMKIEESKEIKKMIKDELNIE